MTYAKPGRASVKVRVRSVESALCPERGYEGAVHLLRNSPAAVTRCLFCRRTWAELDAGLRGGAA